MFGQNLKIKKIIYIKNRSPPSKHMAKIKVMQKPEQKPPKLQTEKPHPEEAEGRAKRSLPRCLPAGPAFPQASRPAPGGRWRQAKPCPRARLPGAMGGTCPCDHRRRGLRLLREQGAAWTRTPQIAAWPLAPPPPLGAPRRRIGCCPGRAILPAFYKREGRGEGFAFA